MADYMSMDNLKYTFFDVVRCQELLKFDRFKDYDEESFNILLDSIKDWADSALFPYFREMDEKPTYYDDGKIIVHPQIGEIMRYCGENGLIGAYFDYKVGGQQMPHTLQAALSHITQCANNHVTGYPALTAGAANLIIRFGNDELIDKYVPNMVAGQWGGTMCLTEPQAGSSLSDITSSAVPTDEGYYKMTGQKIFISGGDHEYCENFVHLYLARIEGAPSGTKGISLFVVPKYRLSEKGELEPNDVITAGDFQKLGQRGYCTTHLILGENNNCHGWLVGEPNKGLKYMFQMMNGARLDVGMTAVSTATAAYYASLQYAKERPQGRPLTSSGRKDPNQPQTLIINHPDVRRMLLLQKAIIEPSLSLLLYCTKLNDIHENAHGQEREDAHDLLEFLTPIAKTYPSSMGEVAISNGLQVLGGYGYCSEFVLQQYYRDIRIMSLYEGTTGIQSLDLLGRKTTMKNGKAIQLLTKVMTEDIIKARTYNELTPYADKLQGKLKDVGDVLTKLMPFAMKGDYERFLADATIYMEMTSTIVMAWQCLIMATTAKEALVTGQLKFGSAFYESKIHTMKFYFTYELPKTLGMKEVLLNDEVLTIVSEKEVIN